MLRKVARFWAGYLLFGFHPWQCDDRAVIDGADSRYAEARPAAKAA